MINRRFAAAVVVAFVAATTAACTSGNSLEASPSPTTIEVDSLDPATREYLAQTAKAMSDQLGLTDPPDIAPIRFISLNEWGPTQIGCLNEAGFDARATDDGEGVAYPLIDDEALKASLNLAIYICEMSYPTDPKYMSPLSTSALQALYQYRTTDLLECLASLGYEVSARPPSEAVFIQSNGEWTPYSAIVIPQDDLKNLYSSCPQTPDSVYGN